MTIRPERPPDAKMVRRIVERSFAAVPYSDYCEQDMVDRLRESSAYIPELSLIGELDGEDVSFVMLTRAEIVGDREATPTLALAPLAVVPEAQGRGVGQALVRAVH